jgi:hypothetical protein
MEDNHRFTQIFGDLLLEKGSASEEHINIIRGVRNILRITEIEKKAKWYNVLSTISQGRTTLKIWKDVLTSYKTIEEATKSVVDGFDFKPEIENVLTEDMDKNAEIAMPKRTVGQLYPTPEQVKEMIPTAKKSLTYNREAKKLGSKIGGLLKQFDKQEVTQDTKKDMVEFLTANLETLIDGYIAEKEGKETSKPDTKKVIESKLEAALARIEELEAKAA